MNAISIYEVGPRDGLQSLGRTIPLRKKVKLVNKLKKSGLENIEVGSLVHPSILSMRDSEKLYKKTGGDLLVLNEKGFERAMGIGADSINIVISPSDDFNMKNQKITYKKALEIYEKMSNQITINRLYISCSFSEDIPEEDVLKCVEWGKNIAKTVILCDTESVGNVEKIRSICSQSYSITPNLGVHLHISEYVMDCIRAAYESGIRVFDTSIGGLGGCVSVGSAEGNVPTEQLVMWAVSNGIPITNKIQLSQLYSTSRYAVNLECSGTERLGRWLSQRVGMYI